MKQKKVDDFERFWAAYPSKTGRIYTKKCFDKIKDDEGLVEKIMLALDSQKRWRRRARGKSEFVPEWKNPSTWLNQGCWDDQIPSASMPPTIADVLEKKICSDCGLEAVTVVEGKFYCTRHYSDKFTSAKKELYKNLVAKGMGKQKDETIGEYYARAKQWCLGNGYETGKGDKKGGGRD